MKKRYVSDILLDIWITIIFINSLFPGDLSSAQSGFVVHLVQNFFHLFGFEPDQLFLSSFIRTLAHFVEFAILGLLIKVNLNKKPYPFYVMMIFGFVIALTDEIIQIFVPGRAFQLFDIMIDVLGVLTGVIIGSFIMGLMAKKTKLLEDDIKS